MSTNLNGGKVNDFDLEDDMEEESTSSKAKNKEDLKKFIIKLMLVVGGSVLLLILVLFLSSMVTKKKYTYEQVEEIMADAAKAFIAENSEYSTILESRIIEVPVENLVAAGKMKPLAEYKNENCTGKVIVSKVNNEYIYTPTLNCGTNYSSTALYTKVLGVMRNLEKVCQTCEVPGHSQLVIFRDTLKDSLNVPICLFPLFR